MIRSSIIYTGSQAILLLVGLLSSVVISRALGPEGRGALALVGLVVTTATLFATFGFGTAYTYFAGKRSFPTAELVGSTLTMSALLGGATVGVLLAASDLLLGGPLRGLSVDQYRLALISVP